jgi:hypothetical protein
MTPERLPGNYERFERHIVGGLVPCETPDCRALVVASRRWWDLCRKRAARAGTSPGTMERLR